MFLVFVSFKCFYRLAVFWDNETTKHNSRHWIYMVVTKSGQQCKEMWPRKYDFQDIYIWKAFKFLNGTKLKFISTDHCAMQNFPPYFLKLARARMLFKSHVRESGVLVGWLTFVRQQQQHQGFFQHTQKRHSPWDVPSGWWYNYWFWLAASRTMSMTLTAECKKDFRLGLDRISVAVIIIIST